MTPNRFLTKSRFKTAIECPTKLFYYGKSKEYKNTMQEDSFMAMLAEGGYQVGELAKLRYPDGIEILEKTHAEAHTKTLECLKQENVVLFEPAILVGNFFIRIDVLVKQGNRFELIEVKAKSYDSANSNIAGKRKSISSEYLPYIQDAAFQTWILKEAYPTAEITTFLMMPDKAHPSSMDGVNQMFKIGEHSQVTLNIPKGLDTKALAQTLLAKVCVDEYVAEVLTTPLVYPGGEGKLSNLANTWAEAYEYDKKVAPVIGKQCGGCQFKADKTDSLKSGFHECWKEANNWHDNDFDDGTVLDVWNYHKKQDLIDQGIYKISQIDRHDIGDFEDEADESGLNRKQRQWLQVNGIPVDYDCGGFYFDKPYAMKEMASWHYPLHLIDFETSSVALPFYSHMRPYEAVAFQFSHHTLEADGTVRHAGEFICVEPGVFPNYDFARELKKQLSQDNGSIFMWSHHENTILNAIIRQLSEDANPPADAVEVSDFLKTIVKSGDRAMVDLCTFAEKAFYHPDTKGSNSIKQVLPAILKVSPKLQSIYSHPIYGVPNGISSLNFSSSDGFTWFQKNSDGTASDPYKALKQYAKDMLPIDSDKDAETSIIADGGAATVAYSRLQFEDIDQDTRNTIVAAMLRYCELDTLAMVMILQGWQDITNAVSFIGNSIKE